jgi:uncharacterized protein with HEPN domain
MLTAPMLQIIRDAGEAVLILTDGLSEPQLLGSRLTRHEVRRQLCTLADCLAGLSVAAHAALPEIDWAGWRAARAVLDIDGVAQDDALMFGVRSLVPATLTWLKVYEQAQPELFTAWH